MKTSRLVAIMAASFTAGILFVVACSDDSPGDADAAACDCPAAEPPLVGRIVPVTVIRSIPANGSDSVVAVCPSGATILGGGCRHENLGGMTLEEAGPDYVNPTQPSYWCRWRSTAPQASMATAEAICLVPAQ